MLRDCWWSIVIWLGVLFAAIAIPLLTYDDAESCLVSPALAVATMRAPDAAKDFTARCGRGS